MRTGSCDLPLHHGKAPKWLFERMVTLSRAIFEVIERDFGRDEFLKRLSDPFWFQSLACVLGYDFHSSGTTTVTCGALKEALTVENHGVVFLGGKGKASKKTPEEIEKIGEMWNLSSSKINALVYASKAAAKVDNSLIQDGYQLYHHSFIMAEDGKWAVIQQGMNDASGYARRYHWLSDEVKEFVIEPHVAICCDRKEKIVLNMTAKESEESRKAAVDLVKEAPEKLCISLKDASQTTLTDYGFTMQREHEIDLHMYKKLIDLNDFQPKNYEELIMFKGVGPKTIRALALLSELVYGIAPSWRDPVRFSFAHGGKDGFPYTVDREQYDKSIEILKSAISEAKIGNEEKLKAFRRLKECFVHA
jgi:hypothetical protein